MAESTEITPFKPVMPLATPEEARKGWAAYEALKAALLTGDDYQQIAGKAFIKRSGFRKIAVYFGLSDKILEQERVDREDKSFTWRIVVEARAPNGRVSVGVSMCDSAERKFTHLEHDVYATAHTRAKSRAISDMIAGGAVSAEEMEAQEERPPRTVEGNPHQGKASAQLSVTEALTRAGVDPRLVEIHREGGATYVYPTSGLVEWTSAKAALEVIGYGWDAASKRWERLKHAETDQDSR
jgi:hypothetical protein